MVQLSPSHLGASALAASWIKAKGAGCRAAISVGACAESSVF
jgi:hypothetical protein